MIASQITGFTFANASLINHYENSKPRRSSVWRGLSGEGKVPEGKGILIDD
jgi:hypothetical protein